MRRATSKAVCDVFAASLRRYGIPDEILTDNGKVFTARFGPYPTEVLFDRICRENGISHRHTGVRSPTTTGKIERFHQSLRKEFLADRCFPSLEVAQAELDAWVGAYNTERPHQALDMATPAERFRLDPLAKDASSIPVDEAEDHLGQWVLRRVASNGLVSWTTRCSPWETPTRRNSWTCSSTTRRSRCGVRTTWSKRWPDGEEVGYGKSELTVYTSSISRLQNVKHQLRPNRAHQLMPCFR